MCYFYNMFSQQTTDEASTHPSHQFEAVLLVNPLMQQKIGPIEKTGHKNSYTGMAAHLFKKKKKEKSGKKH